MRTTQPDVTDRLVRCADAQQPWQAEVCGYVFKQDSPSCGMERVKVFRNEQPEYSGTGIYASRVMHNFPDLPVEEEGRLGVRVLRDNFIQRVFVFRRWQQLMASVPDWTAVTNFHARHKYVLMSHDQDHARNLGRWLSDARTVDSDELFRTYLTRLMKILKIVATRDNHVNVLQHIQGYLKTRLVAADKRELVETIEQYRTGLLPLVVPIALLRHHFRRQPDAISHSHTI